MSDYVHKKVVRYPLQGLMDKLDTKYLDDCEDYIQNKLGCLYGNDFGFEIEITDKNSYLDFVYYNTYGESSGDFGNVRLATDEEYYLLEKYLNAVFPQGIIRDNVRVVEYSYYNCCECSDYYELPNNNDDSSKIESVLSKIKTQYNNADK